MKETKPLPFVSVVIATYNRPELLSQTLQTVLAQDYPAASFEVLVVDNNSPPATRAVVESFAGRAPSPRWILEEQQGVSNARNNGIRQARGEIVVFADDDILAATDWLRKLVEPFAGANGRRIGAVGGTVLPVFPEGCPSWWQYTHPLKLSERCELLPPGQERKLMGANLAIVKSALDEAGGFAADLGRRGTALLDGEEPELLGRVRAAGYEVWFAGEAVVQHQMPMSRLTFHYACRNAFDSARTRVIGKVRGGVVARRALWPYLVGRLAGNLLVVPVWLLAAGACGLCGRAGLVKGFLVRACRSLGYVRQIVSEAVLVRKFQ